MTARPARIALAVVQGSLACETAFLVLLLAAGTRTTAATRPRPAGEPLRMVILVPAHDEERDVATAVASLVGQDHPEDRREVIVIADNCADATAAKASAAGATVWERRDPEARGKGQALAWALDRLWQERPDVEAVTIVDADCVASRRLCRELDAALRVDALVAQARYVVSNPDASSAAALRWAGFALMHIVRPRGKRRLGLSCGLFGTGMAFRAEVLRSIGWPAVSVTEDTELHLDLVERGYAVAYVDAAYVASRAPTTTRTADVQQMRWATGNTRLVGRGVSLLAQGLVTRDRQRVGAAMERLIPAQSVLVAATAVTGACSLSLRARGVATLSALTLAGQAAYVIGGLLLARAPQPVWLALLSAPRLIFVRIGQTARLVRGRGHRSWVRTSRE